MAGLALGSLLAGRLADRVRHPLGVVRRGRVRIALTAVASPWMLNALERAVCRIVPIPAIGVRRGHRPPAPQAGAALIVPTVLMGTTLPLVPRSSLVTGGKLGLRLECSTPRTRPAPSSERCVGFVADSGVRDLEDVPDRGGGQWSRRRSGR